MAESTSETSKAGLISLEQGAKLLMCTPQWFLKLVKDGYIPRASRGAYPLVGTVQGHIRYMKDEDRRSTKTAGDSRVKDARAEEIELRIYDRSQALLTKAREEALAVIDSYGGGLKSDLLSIPARVTKDLALRRRIESEINGAFGAATKRIASSIAGASPPAAALDGPAGRAPERVGVQKPDVSAKRRRARSA